MQTDRSKYDLRYQAEQIIGRDEEPEPKPVQTIGSDDLPEPFGLNTVFDNPPEMAPVLIEGVLRQGHKMLLSAPSKAGKSFALIRLAIAFAEGYKWFGSRCRQGKVLYINMEIDDASCINRFMKIYKEELKLDCGAHTENIEIWGLRGHSQPLRKLTNKIIEKAKHDYIAIIIDPLYKVMDGDENNNSDISRMVGYFDRIARETGAAVIYAHHFAKGTSGDKSVIDRAAGAGTFARDPDAIVTMTQLDMPPEVNEIHTAWRVEYILREFPNKKPYDVWFEYPTHRYDEALAEEHVETSYTKQKRQRMSNAEKEKDERTHIIHEIVSDISRDGKFLAKDFADKYLEFEDISQRTAKRRLLEAGYEAEPQPGVGQPTYWRRKAGK